ERSGLLRQPDARGLHAVVWCEAGDLNTAFGRAESHRENLRGLPGAQLVAVLDATDPHGPALLPVLQRARVEAVPRGEGGRPSTGRQGVAPRCSWRAAPQAAQRDSAT